MSIYAAFTLKIAYQRAHSSITLLFAAYIVLIALVPGSKGDQNYIVTS